MKISTFLILPVILLSNLGNAFAQFTVSAYVMDIGTRQPLVGAHILLVSAIEKSLISDTSGFFKLENITDEDIILISYLGYKEKILSLDSSNKHFEILLEPLAVKLEEVVVKSSILGAENFAFEKLESIDIYLNPNSKADALVAINTSVSSSTTDENAAVAFRGFSSNQTGYFLNGFPIKEPVKYAQLTNTGTLSIFNTDFLRTATVFAGNPPIEYGQSTSGTIAIELVDRLPDEWQHTSSISLANIGYSLRGKLKDQTFLGAFTNYQFDKALKATNPKNYEKINAFRSADAGILLNSHQKWGSIKFYQYVLWDNYDFQYSHPSYKNGFLQKSVRSISTLQWIQEFNNWQARIVLGNSLSNKKYTFGNLNYSQQNFDPYAATHFTWLKKSDLLKIGYSYWKQQSIIDGNFPTLSYALAPNHPIDTMKYKNTLNTHEVYTFFRKQIKEHSFGAGIRIGNAQAINKELLSYQMNYLWKPIKAFQLKIGAGKYYQVSNLIDEEVQFSKQLAIDLKYKNRYLAVSQSLYINEINDKYIKGSETTLSQKLSNKLQFDHSVAIIKNEENIKWFTRSFLVYKPLALWSFNISYQSFKGDSTQLITSSSYNSDLDVFEPLTSQNNYTQFDPYRNLSIGINRLYNSKKSSGVFFINVNNLLNNKNTNNINYNYNYSNYATNYLSSRSFYAGLIINF